MHFFALTFMIHTDKISSFITESGVRNEVSLYCNKQKD